MDPELESIRRELTDLAGGGKRLAPGMRMARGIGLYSTIHLPGLDDMAAVRNTLERLDDFHVETDLSGVSALDVGSNEGSFSFEFAKRGANVTAVEYRQDRVDLSRRIAKRWELDVAFHQGDLTAPIGPWSERKYDVVWCVCVTKFIKDPDLDAFFLLLRRLTSGELLLECNRGTSAIDTELRLKRAGFTHVNYLGCLSRRRRSFIAS